MHKYRFYITPDSIKDDIVVLPKEEAHHAIHVLNLKEGDNVILFDGIGGFYEGQIINEKLAEVHIVSKEEFLPSKKLTVYTSLAKSKKNDLIIRQLTEIGCYKIVVFVSQRSIPVLSKEKTAKRSERYKRIALEASKQSRREYVPEVEIITWNTLLETLEKSAFVMYEEGGTPLKECINEDMNEVSIIVGPEGGFTKEEIEQLSKVDVKTCSLGKYILRVETAAVFAASVAATLMNNDWKT